MGTKFTERELPNYTRGEEIFNMVSHIVGGAFAIAALVLCVIASAIHDNIYGIVASSIYGATMIMVYCVSSVYHGLIPITAKKVFRILDHCTIYFLIAGTYMPVLLSAIRPINPVAAWVVFGIECAMLALAVTLTAVDMTKFQVFSMVCYITMGWAIIGIYRIAIEALTLNGFLWLLLGGICYTIGSILYGLGKKKKCMHGVFHIFVLLGSIFQFICIYFYAI